MKSIIVCPWVGTAFVVDGDNVFKKLTKLIKPYLAVAFLVLVVGIRKRVV